MVGPTNPPDPRDSRGNERLGGCASGLRNPVESLRRHRAGSTDTVDSPPEAGGGGRRSGRQSAPRAPPRSGGDNIGYGATSRPDCWARSRPQLIPRPLARHSPPNPSLPKLTPFSSSRVPHQRHKRLLANSPGASEAGDGPFAGTPLFSILRPIDRQREFANSIPPLGETKRRVLGHGGPGPLLREVRRCG